MFYQDVRDTFLFNFILQSLINRIKSSGFPLAAARLHRVARRWRGYATTSVRKINLSTNLRQRGETRFIVISK